MSSFLRKYRIAIVAILVIILSGADYAQETTGSISGTVSDSTGAAIKGVTVVLTTRSAVRTYGLSRPTVRATSQQRHYPWGCTRSSSLLTVLLQRM